MADGTNRIGDLEFRLVELEGGDVSQLGSTTTLGGATPATIPVNVTTGQTGADAPQLATQEAADFRQAEVSFSDGDYLTAVEQYSAFTANYPGGPMEIPANIRRGEALEQLGDTREAARAFLHAFTLDQTGTNAPEALFRLGAALGALGTQTEACVTLAEVPARFPGSPFAASAQTEQSKLGCG